MQRYFLTENMQQEVFTITGDDVHHIVRVMRMQIGDELYICLQNGDSAVAEIVELSKEAVVVKPLKWLEETKELPVAVSIVTGLTKADKYEYVLQKATELGADSFIPYKAQRSIVKWDEKKSTSKIDRWKKIIKEAAEQSHRTLLPNISAPLSIKEVIEYSKSYEYKFIAFEETAKDGVHSVLAESLKSVQKNDRIIAVFGPEGGLSDKEVDLLMENGFICCSLGPRILRAETAPLYFLSCISYQTELMR